MGIVVRLRECAVVVGGRGRWVLGVAGPGEAPTRIRATLLGRRVWVDVHRPSDLRLSAPLAAAGAPAPIVEAGEKLAIERVRGTLVAELASKRAHLSAERRDRAARASAIEECE